LPNDSIGKNYSCDAFGNTTQSGSSPVNSNLRFASGYHEPAPHNLYQFGTRSYDPTIGRLTQQDALPGTIQGPSELDAYLYVGDDPVNYVDPSGLCWSGLCWAKHAAQKVGCTFKRHPVLASATVVLGAAALAMTGVGVAGLVGGGISAGTLGGLGVGIEGAHGALALVQGGAVLGGGAAAAGYGATRRC
jgi:RHS repeat-associated protein